MRPIETRRFITAFSDGPWMTVKFSVFKTVTHLRWNVPYTSIELVRQKSNLICREFYMVYGATCLRLQKFVPGDRPVRHIWSDGVVKIEYPPV